jgi:hypothetical protein
MRTLLALGLLVLAAPALAGVPGVLIDGRPAATPGSAAVLAEVSRDPRLGPAREVVVAGRRYVHWRQEVGGVPVLGCSFTATVAAGGGVASVHDDRCAAGTPAALAVGAEAAAATAAQAVRARGDADRLVTGRPAMRYRRRGTSLEPVWAVDVATAAPWGAWRVFVSGVTGQVVRMNDVALRARGLVYPTAKAAGAGRAAMRPLPGLVAGNLLNGRMVTVGDTTDFLAQCDQDYLFCDPPHTDTCSARGRGGKFLFRPSARETFGTCTTEDRFDQVTGYYNLARMAEYFERQIGWTPGSGTLAGLVPLPVLANVPALFNAFFTPPSEGWPDDGYPAFLAFGDEFAAPLVNDFVRDPTVPRHEFSHAVMYDTGSAINDFFDCTDHCDLGDGSLLHEALADYFAIASLGGRESVVGSQLGDGLAAAARDLRNDFRFPCDLANEPHADGRIWSAFLYEVRSLLGKRLDAVVFASLLDLPHKPNLRLGDALGALMRALPPLPERTLVRIVAAAVRKGLVGPTARQRGDDVTIDTGDLPWTCAPGTVCSQVDQADAGDAENPEQAARVAIGDAFGTGLAARVTLAEAVDVFDNPFVHALVRASRALAAGELELVLSGDADCGTALVTLPLPALPADAWKETFLPLDADLTGVLCAGLRVAADTGAVTVDLDDVGTLGSTPYGSVVEALRAGRRLAIRNRFPAPWGDAHFYYFTPPAGASRVTVGVVASKKTDIPPDLVYCGDVGASGDGKVDPELNNVFLWAYDPDKPPPGIQFTPLPIDQHRLLTAVPAKSQRARRLRRFALPPSPTNVYAVSVQGAGEYRLKLAFQ